MAEIPGWVKFCGDLAPVAAIVVFLSPFPTISQIEKDKNVGALPLLPYSSMFANCFLWSIYGILKNESKIWATNGIGIAFSIFYFLRFVKFAPAKSPTFPGSVRQHVQAISCIMAGTVALVYLSPFRDPANLLGNIAVMFCVAMFASPLAALRTVLQTKSARSIPLPFTLATVLNCFLWSVFGLLEIHDANVYIPNLLGLAFGIAQVFLKLLYKEGAGGHDKLASNLDLIA